MKIISIVGARPQFIKLAPLCRALNEKRETIDVLQRAETLRHFDKLSAGSAQDDKRKEHSEGKDFSPVKGNSSKGMPSAEMTPAERAERDVQQTTNHTQLKIDPSMARPLINGTGSVTDTPASLYPTPNSQPPLNPTPYHHSPITHLICHTGQHFDEEMSKLFFEQLEIPAPDYNLGLSRGKHAEQTGRMLIGIEEILLNEKPDLVIVFGDTNSTLAGSLAAAKMNIKSIHIEAGLRSFNRSMPEEINRIVSDHISDYLFAPTNTAVENLKNEGLTDRTFLTGDIMVDSLADNIEKAKQSSGILEKLGIKSGTYYLLTLHRPYTVDDPSNLEMILSHLSTLGKEIIFPVHPRTMQVIEDNKIKISNNINLIKPLGYLDFIILEQGAEKIITDSGGIQKEAYILKKPCITLRPETEWVETVREGWNILVLPDDKYFSKKILDFNPTSKQNDIFGKNVAEKMVNKILEIFS